EAAHAGAWPGSGERERPIAFRLRGTRRRRRAVDPASRAAAGRTPGDGAASGYRAGYVSLRGAYHDVPCTVDGGSDGDARWDCAHLARGLEPAAPCGIG